MNTKRWITFVGLVALCSAPAARGWGEEGHRITGAIAERYLSPEAKAEIAKLVPGRSLADISTWADEIRSNHSYDWAKPLHYANVTPGMKEFDLKRDCPAQGCVVSAITKYAHILADQSASHADRAEALKFLVHFVGDIHQPLHVSHEADRGGNDIKVTFLGHPTNLHRVWDTDLVEYAHLPWPAFAGKLASQITPKDVVKWSAEMKPEEWATESYRLAVDYAYQVPASGVLDDAYAKRCVPIVEKRLKMAGVRMAKLLNATLGHANTGN